RTEAGKTAPSGVGDEHDVAAAAAVTAVRPASRDELLPTEVDRPVAAATRNHVQLGAIVKHRGSRCQAPPKAVPGTALGLAGRAVDDGDKTPLAAGAKGHHAITRREDRVVLADAG